MANIRECDIRINKSEQSLTVFYLDPELQKIAVSEVSVLPIEALTLDIFEMVKDKQFLESISHAIDNSKSYGFYSRLNVPEALQKRGIGEELLKRTIQECEKDNMFLLNTVHAYGSLDHDKLMEFYSKHGMTPVDDGLLVYSKNLSSLNKNISKELDEPTKPSTPKMKR